jgi:hypothetical protein
LRLLRLQVLALRTLLYAGKRVLFVVPYVSIVVEKVRCVARLFTYADVC